VAEYSATLARSGGRVTGVFTRGGNQIESEVRGDVTASGEVTVRGKIAGKDFQVTGGKTDSPVQSTSVSLSDDQRYLLAPWSGLSDELQALSPAEDDLCQSCLLVGAVVVQSANLCVDGDPGACSVLIDSYALFQSHCDPPPCT
jgi:hypothetical protein